jgi:hypothetical protein
MNLRPEEWNLRTSQRKNRLDKCFTVVAPLRPAVRQVKGMTANRFNEGRIKKRTQPKP